jgi:1-acyl-sn-glycerol-3-phosphate acyltransferase
MKDIVEPPIKETLKARGICVIIPTYNNMGTVAQVVHETLSYCDDVIVVNDGSTDGTSKLLESIPSITVVSYPKNRGKGHALKTGFRKALELGFSYAITLDSDGQHYPSDIPLFLKANQEHPGTLIVGARDLTGVVRSKGSNFANKFSNFWFYIQTGRKLDDTQTGYRLYPLKKLYGLSLLTNKYEAELELLVFSSWHGVELVQIPVHVYYPPQEERVSHFRPGWDFFRITVLNTVLCFLAVVYGLPLRILRWLLKYIRTIYTLLFFLIAIWVVITPFVYLYVKIGKMTEKKRKNLHNIICTCSRLIMLVHGIPGTKFRYKVQDESVFDKPSVIICNHQSHLDLVCQMFFTPNMIFLTNDWVWNNPTYGFLIRNAEFYPVREGMAELLPKLKSLKERGYSIAIYPEGTRSKDCKIGRFHQGAFYVARELNMDVLPMCLYGPGKVLKKGTYHLNKGQMYVEVGKRITPEELSQYGGLREQASAMRKRYIRKYTDLCNELEQDA